MDEDGHTEAEIYDGWIRNGVCHLYPLGQRTHVTIPTSSMDPTRCTQSKGIT